MNYQAFTNDSLTMMYAAVRGALAADDAAERQGGEPTFKVRDTPEWKKHAAASQLPNTDWPGARSSGGRGLARPVVPGGASLLAVLVSIRSRVVKNAATIAITTATAKSRTAVRWLFRSYTP